MKNSILILSLLICSVAFGQNRIRFGNASGVTDGDKGAITVSNSGADWNLNSGINASLIGNGQVSTTEYQYLSDVVLPIQQQIDSKLNNSGGSMSGNLSFLGLHKIVNLVDPTNAQDAATKAYVDGISRIQSDTTGLGSAAYKPITNFIAWDYSVSTTPPTLTANEYAVQINAPANVAVDETMDGSDHQQKLIYDDRTADVATITFSNLELGQEIVIYFNRTALPTFSGATMKEIPTGSETFQADTETVLYGFVNPDGEIDYTIKELTP